ncbi:MAG: flagellar biosynthesis protein FlhF [Thermotogota bacterium]
MKIKKYVVEDVKDALKQIKRDLGEDAVILGTRKFKSGGFLGFGSRTKYEVTAVAEEKKEEIKSKTPPKDEEWIDSKKLYELKRILSKNVQAQAETSPSPKERPKTPSVPSTGYSVGLPKAEKVDEDSSFTRLSGVPATEWGGGDDAGARDVSGLRKDMLAMKRMIQDLSVKIGKEHYLPGLPERFRRIYEALIDQEVNQDLSRRMVESLRIVTNDGMDNTMEVERKFSEVLSPAIRTDNFIKNHEKGDILFFIGPTGVGKTTTLTKIAAMLSLEMRKRIGILTIDTYRIAAVDQLKTSADIMGIGVGVAYNPKELSMLLERFKDFDLVLVDTAGRNQKNELQMNELSRYLQIVNPKYKLLTMSMNTRSKDMYSIIEHFSVIAPTHLILTKMDETSVYGSFLELSSRYDIPVCFITNGQRIPEDIMIADSKRLASFIVKEVLTNARPVGNA